MDFPWNLLPDLRWNRFLGLLAAFWDAEPRVEILGVSHDGTPGGDATVRFKASLATERVRVHVQRTGGGGGLDYDPDNHVSSEVVDTFANRQRDVTIARNGADRYKVFLIPVVRHGDGSTVNHDGREAADHMAFWTL